MQQPMNDNPKVVRFPGSSKLDWSVDEVFRCATENKITDAIVIGRLPSGQLYLDHTQAHVADVNWVLDQIKAFLLDANK